MNGRCSACNYSCRYVAPHTPRTPHSAEVMFIGEKPSIERGNYSSLMPGQAFYEFQRTYLPLADLQMSDIWLTNAVCCTDGSTRKTPDKLLSTCAQSHLSKEINRCNPSTIILLGAAPCSLIPQIQLDRDHGLPILSQSLTNPALNSDYFSDWSGTIIPMYSPALGLRDTGMMIPLLEDFSRLKTILRGQYEAPGTRHLSHSRQSPHLDYSVATRLEIERDIDLADSSEYLYLPVDSEDDCGKPFSLQYSLRPGHGRIVLLDQKQRDSVGQLRAFQHLINQFDGLVMHNASHDLSVLEELGLKVRRFRDTMQEAYHLGNLPQGLKALAWRLLGIRMQSWEDLVTEPSKKLLYAWLLDRMAEQEPVVIRTPYKRPLKRNGELKLEKVEIRQNATEKIIRRILGFGFGRNSAATGDFVPPSDTYDPWEKCLENGLESTSKIPIPGKSIAHCELFEIVNYACGDADITGQVALELASIRDSLVASGGDWNVAEEDYDR